MKTPEIDLPAGISWIEAEDGVVLAAALAKAVATELESGLAQQERVTLVVSGGSTPVPFFQALSTTPLLWQRVDVVLADERWVDESDPASNAALVRHHLLQGAAAEARLTGLKVPGLPDATASAQVEQSLEGLTWPATVVVLGMGNDGHTASLFPDAPELSAALNADAPQRVLIMTPPSQEHARITLTLKPLQSSKAVFLHLNGDEKVSALRQACKDIACSEAMPVRAFLQTGLRIYWSP